MPPPPNILIKMKRLADLRPADYNPRRLSEAQYNEIRASIEGFGFVDPVIINTHPGRENVIVGGHQRCKVASDMGLTDVPCVEVDLDPAREKELNVRLNHASGEWDFDMLANHFEQSDLLAWGFTEDELGLGTDEVAPSTGDDNIPDGGLGTPVTVVGDLYEFVLDRIKLRLLCGDSLDLEGVRSKLLEGAEIDMTFTDPPWNVAYGASNNPQYRNGNDRTIQNDSMSTEDFKQFMTDAFATMFAVSKAGAMVYVVMSAQEWGNMMLALKENEFHWSSTIIWKKDRLVMSRKDYHTQYEPIWYGWKEGEARICPLDDRQQSDVWDIPRPSRSDQHPTMKPVELVQRAIQNSSRPGNNVLDLFIGSASTAVACAKTGRNFFGCELDPKHIDRSVIRLNNFLTENNMQFQLLRNGSPIAIETITAANA